MANENFSFNLLKETSASRLGKIYTHRGEIDTPTFMPVGTQGTIKSVFINDVELIGSKIIAPPNFKTAIIFSDLMSSCKTVK